MSQPPQSTPPIITSPMVATTTTTTTPTATPTASVAATLVAAEPATTTTTTASATAPATPAAATTAPAAAPTASTPAAPANRDVEDGKHFVNLKSHQYPFCKAHTPTLEELQKHSFSEYVRQVVLNAARVAFQDEVQQAAATGKNGEVEGEEIHYIEDYEMSQNGFPSKPPLYAEGMAKVTLPDGFWKEEGIGKDRTGRGPAWQKGTELGDLMIPNPIQQCVRGIGGVYEYTLMDQGAISLADLRDQADVYMEEQLLGIVRPSPKKKKQPKKVETPVSGRKTKNSNKKEEEEKKEEEKKAEAKKAEEEAAAAAEKVNANNVEEKKDEKEDKRRKMPTIEEMERKFWKRLGPTMPPATYGADMEGSLFGDDPASGWNLGQLDSFLQLLGPNLPGVTSPYLYMGMWGSVFAVHTEDMNLLSINYLHAGAPKVWYAIAPGQDARRFEALCEHYFAHAHQDCKQFLRHKRYLLSPMILKKAGIKFTFQVQYPGDAMITIPDGYHFGFNTGFNVAEATNFGVPEWIPFGHQAKICMCRPDSVRIDMLRLERLLARYRKENKKKTTRRRKSFRDWGLMHYKATHKDESESESESESEDEENNRNDSNKPSSTSGKNSRKGVKRMKDFWVEVMQPVPSSQRADFGRRVETGTKKNPPSKKRPLSKGKKQQPAKPKEVWHLAKPMTRKGLVAGARVLVMIPGCVATLAETEEQNQQYSDSSDSDESRKAEEDEQCFAGTISEFSDEHCRVHFATLSKDDDVWMHIESNKLFLDGGTWDESHAIKGVPPRHFWQEMDSKRRCV